MQQLPPIREDIAAGIDVGGTKVHIIDTSNHVTHRFATPEYADLDAILEEYFEQVGFRPAKVAVGMAGPRDDDTGAIKLTNGDWPAFDPVAATDKYGVQFTTANDMVATTAGVLVETGVDLLQLKPGTPTKTGTKLVISLSTGIGVAAAMWDEHSKRYVILATEGGHVGFQPKDAEEQDYLAYLHTKYPHASAELALSGKHGIENLVDHRLETKQQLKLTQAIRRAREANRPVGAVLLEFATEGEGADREAAHDVLARLGSMIGSVIRDLTLAYNATGGIYLCGSVSLALGEYLAENTEMNNRIIRHGAVFDGHLAKIPLHLVTNPNVAVLGALEMAKSLE